jgi:hypothetical protein
MMAQPLCILDRIKNVNVKAHVKAHVPVLVSKIRPCQNTRTRAFKNQLFLLFLIRQPCPPLQRQRPVRQVRPLKHHHLHGRPPRREHPS